MAERIYIFDTTLRDGEQSPGCSMTVPEKLKMAAKLVDLGVEEGEDDLLREVLARVNGALDRLAVGQHAGEPLHDRDSCVRGNAADVAHRRLARVEEPR